MATDQGVRVYDISSPMSLAAVDEMPAATAARFVRVRDGIGIVVTKELAEPSPRGYAVVEGGKLGVFRVPAQ